MWPFHVVDLTTSSAYGPRPSFSKLLALAILVWAISTNHMNEWIAATVGTLAFGRSMWRTRMTGQ